MSKVWIRQVFFTLTEHGAIRVLDAITTLVLIRIMAAPEFGLFSVYQSWVAILLFFLPSIEFVLFREYAKLKKEGRLAEELRLYRAFNFLKLGLVTFLVIALSMSSQNQPWNVRVFLLAFAFALPFSQSFYGFLREPLRFEMRQALVAALGMLQRLALLGALLFIAYRYPHDIPKLISGALLVYLLTGFLWSFAAKDFFADAKPSKGIESSYKRLSSIFFSIVLWVHIHGVVIQTVQTFDVFCLNFFKTDLAEIALYGISLKAANFFQVIPIALAHSFGVYLARSHSSDQEKRAVLMYMGIFALLGVVLFAFGALVGKPLLAFLAKGKFDAAGLERCFTYFRWQLAGVLVLAASYPMSTYVNARSHLRQSVLQYAIPWALLSIGVYFWAASHGPLMAAYMNVVVPLINMALLVRFWMRRRL